MAIELASVLKEIRGIPLHDRERNARIASLVDLAEIKEESIKAFLAMCYLIQFGSPSFTNPSETFLHSLILHYATGALAAEDIEYELKEFRENEETSKLINEKYVVDHPWKQKPQQVSESPSL